MLVCKKIGHAMQVEELAARVNWARSKVDDLSASARAFLQDAGYQYREELQDDGMIHALILGAASPPTGLAIEAGLVAHELRATLDSLACNLAVKNNKTPNGVSFPLFSNADDFAAKGRNSIRKLATADQEKVTAWQQFNSADPRITQLRSLDNHRKHVKLATIGTRGGLHASFDYAGIFKAAPSRVLSGTGKTDFACWSPDSRNIRITINVGISFAEPEEVNGLVFDDALISYADLVDQVLADFF